MRIIYTDLYPIYAPYVYATKKEYCCIDMDNAVLKGIVHYDNVVHGEPEYDSYYIEVVKGKKKKDHIIWETVDFITEDIMLRYCSYCGKEL